MYSIQYSEKSLLGLKGFIDSYKNSFVRILKDSGLDFEDVMIQNYIDIGDKFYESIISKIKERIGEGMILGKSVGEYNEQYVTISVNGFRLFVYYREDKQNYKRYIENIEFFRK